eukprot:4476008-Lingulodinium_polyedra.AAC.1
MAAFHGVGGPRLATRPAPSRADSISSEDLVYEGSGADAAAKRPRYVADDDDALAALADAPQPPLGPLGIAPQRAT